MKNFLLLICCLSVLRVSAQSFNQSANYIILDTDAVLNADDVGVMGMLHALSDKGEVTPLAVISSNKNAHAVPVIEILNTYFGRPALAVAAAVADAPDQAASGDWISQVLDKYPHQNAEAADAVKVYRQLLSSQPDQSVTIVSIGFLSNLAALIASPADQFSPLQGEFLVRKKVRRLVSTREPVSIEHAPADSAAARKCFAGWPSEIVFTGSELGRNIKTGARLVGSEYTAGPVKDVYTHLIAGKEEAAAGLASVDQVAMLVAARGIQPYFALRRGRFSMATWQDDPMGNHAYLTADMPAEALSSIIEGLMMWNKRK